MLEIQRWMTYAPSPEKSQSGEEVREANGKYEAKCSTGGLGRGKGGFLKPMLFNVKLGELAKQRGKERCTRKREQQGKGREMEICVIKIENSLV